MILPIRMALVHALRAIKMIAPEDIRGHLSRRHTRRALDRYSAALSAYMAAYQDQYGALPRLWRCSMIEEDITHAGILESLSGRKKPEEMRDDTRDEA